jgi:cell division protease FtsH
MNIYSRRRISKDLRSYETANYLGTYATVVAALMTLQATQTKPRRLWVGILVCVFIIFGGVFLWTSLSKEPQQVPYTDFENRVLNAEIESVVIIGQTIRAITKHNDLLVTDVDPARTKDLVPNLIAQGVSIEFSKSAPYSLRSVWPWLIAGVSAFVTMLFLYVAYRRATTSQAAPFYLGKSRAHLSLPRRAKITFQDVVLSDEAMAPVQCMIEFLKEPQKFQKLGATIDKAILFVGPPGTGKTLLLSAFGEESKVPVFEALGSEFTEMYPGVGAARVRDMFEQGRKHAPCIIVIDQLEALCRPRPAWPDPVESDAEMAVQQLLGEIDGFRASDGVLVVAATNRPDLIDEALVRPGRFAVVEIKEPDVAQIERILRVHASKYKLAASVDIPELASELSKRIPSCTGAHVNRVLNTAGLLAAGGIGADGIGMEHLMAAVNKVKDQCRLPQYDSEASDADS